MQEDVALMKQDDGKANMKCWSAPCLSLFLLHQRRLSGLYSYSDSVFSVLITLKLLLKIVDSEMKHEKTRENNSRCFTESACWVNRRCCFSAQNL